MSLKGLEEPLGFFAWAWPQLLQRHLDPLPSQEWNKELEALLEDMKDKAGILKKRCPDRKTEAGAAYSRVKAVYGRVDELEKLEDKEGVTQHLGTVKHICAETVSKAAAGGSPVRQGRRWALWEQARVEVLTFISYAFVSVTSVPLSTQPILSGLEFEKRTKT